MIYLQRYLRQNTEIDRLWRAPPPPPPPPKKKRCTPQRKEPQPRDKFIGHLPFGPVIIIIFDDATGQGFNSYLLQTCHFTWLIFCPREITGAIRSSSLEKKKGVKFIACKYVIRYAFMLCKD